MGEKTEPASVEYRVTSNGSVVEEILFPGTPHEMVSIYHDRKGRLCMTHYCAMGNRPFMELKSADPRKIQLVLAAGSEIDAERESHMHALTIENPDIDSMIHHWVWYEAGQEAGTTVITVQRQTE